MIYYDIIIYIIYICVIELTELYHLRQQCSSGKIHFLLIVSKNFLWLQLADAKAHGKDWGMSLFLLYTHANTTRHSFATDLHCIAYDPLPNHLLLS